MIFALKLPFLVLLFLLMILISVCWPEEGRSFARATNADEAAARAEEGREVTHGNRVHSNRGFSAKKPSPEPRTCSARCFASRLKIEDHMKG